MYCCIFCIEKAGLRIRQRKKTTVRAEMSVHCCKKPEKKTDSRSWQEEKTFKIFYKRKKNRKEQKSTGEEQNKNRKRTEKNRKRTENEHLFFNKKKPQNLAFTRLCGIYKIMCVTGFEPTTFWSVARRSIQLSYTHIFSHLVFQAT